MLALSPIDRLSINCIRFLAAEAVQSANSGHPGLPMGFAPFVYRLFTKHLKQDPQKPNWPGRDRFVLSAGHGSALLYSMLHLCGYDLSLEDLKQFRQLGSKTPGHPEFGHTAGVEVTTGPLGQGLANAVGLAIALKHVKARYQRPGFELFDQKVYVMVGDGCLQEGVGAEAASLAGHLGLDNLVVLYDDNQITIDGQTSLSFTEDVAARFRAYGWMTQEIGGDGHDLGAFDGALEKAKTTPGAPHLIKIRTQIGFGSPKAGTASVHGSPLGAEGLAFARKALDWSYGPFEIPAEVAAHFAELGARNKAQVDAANLEFGAYMGKFPKEGQELMLALQGTLPPVEWPTFKAGDSIATRAASGKVLNAIMPRLPLFMGGSADLSPSNNTQFEGAVDFQKNSPEGRYLRFGVREHAMGAVVNGINQSGVLRAYCATFLSFADYMLPAVRVAALSSYKSIFVFTHDSIGVGEDGPTHQPVEQVAYLRFLPGLTSFRPADAAETVEAWRFALGAQGPVAMSLTRQNLPVIDRTKYAAASGVAQGGYVLAQGPSAQVVLIATGSEVSLAMAAYEQLAQEGIGTILVSLPSAELFEAQPAEYQEQTIPSHLPRVCVEAGIEAGMARYLGSKGRFVGMRGFGASGPAPELYKHFGITTEAVVQAAKALVQG
ncbi:MAG: transketolase [Candidatus Lambdaproteobacteria bacterium RIFOXYD1_FULL_56_27]|uniref:Transketolase n=1 Tax=Candidatus Lambdaproteobacteria bacterium RIFOXYD2_FULL_56_26 TaxID=1817773 RepID=A0A1F6GSM3_9PROT|nr:MAG: transketolase [Candidatus Lambdaproteobacteria bacterium RIFOXYD2_FULL_56_26]OGH01373.1 MAG: transketolase [Candidatus Lambdaproteobacteria bacterium RIFOXYC1_FULL_56_13]OGH06914.1 MAG: transketolase [Candidatus Lambdaproteobacteria bacterium RIFOXYD1_FULL_56_27]